MPAVDRWRHGRGRRSDCVAFGAVPPSPPMGRPNFYSGAGLDRADHLRGDAAWLESRLRDPATRFVPFVPEQCPTKPKLNVT